ncbi:hypothetical protein AVEN_29804-1 [Araneus ventricosus]|uniref:Uncharacterized protein n=1 Tax=Araneus ventricosus TaxID=182803 RepID=A0A4Y2GHB8_ARAVE|nr:hypothetical protein AVEN_29804-1 [Araneus ventricosus]
MILKAWISWLERELGNIRRESGVRKKRKEEGKRRGRRKRSLFISKHRVAKDIIGYNHNEDKLKCKCDLQLSKKKKLTVTEVTRPNPRVRWPTENHEPAQDFQRGSSSPAPYIRADGLEKIGVYCTSGTQQKPFVPVHMKVCEYVR